MRAPTRTLLLLGCLALTAAGDRARADDKPTTTHTVMQATDIKWGPAPAIMPAGAKLAVLAGDPAKQGLILMRLKMPANYKIPAHWHPTDENISVMSGAFYVGMGDKLDPAKTTAVQPGGFISLPAKMNHFAMTKEETMIELATMGPFQMTYVNPADTPARASMAK